MRKTSSEKFDSSDGNHLEAAVVSPVLSNHAPEKQLPWATVRTDLEAGTVFLSETR